MLREGQDRRNKVTAGVFTFFLFFRLTVLAYHPNIISPPFFSPSPFPSYSIPSLCISIYFSCNLILDGQYISLFLSFSFPLLFFFRSQPGAFSTFPSLFPLYLIPLVTSDRSTYLCTQLTPVLLRERERERSRKHCCTAPTATWDHSQSIPIKQSIATFAPFSCAMWRE